MERKGKETKKKKKKQKKVLQCILCKSEIQINLIEHPSHKKEHNGNGNGNGNCSQNEFGKDDSERVSPYYYVITCMYLNTLR